MTSTMTKEQQALHYHHKAPAGKLAIIATKPLETLEDLSLAYTPWVAVPCLEIAADKRKVFDYTAKSNLVAIITNGTAVLGLGNIGPEASKPVMEGKAVLLKKLAGIDAFDIELDETDPIEIIKIIKALAPTFGGINLEDIKAPECFQIEEGVLPLLSIPTMHDDQHGTAIVTSAALMNAIEVAKKDIAHIKLVVNGAGAAAIACTKLYMNLGVKKENIVMCDSKGVIRRDRKDINKYKAAFATDRPIKTLDEALKGADMFLGVSVANILTPAHLLSMAERPIVFALANPDPEIAYELAMATRNDLIMATGRSDYPNQINNVLGFPYMFRGALDVRATAINEPMKLAAAKAIAALAKEPTKATNGHKPLVFGKNYLLPNPMDHRLITSVSTAVAKAAIVSGVAQISIENWEEYHVALQQRIA